MTHTSSLHFHFFVGRPRESCGVGDFTELLGQACRLAGNRVTRAPLGGEVRDIVRAVAAIRAGDVVVCSFPVIAWKRAILAPFLALMGARLRGATTVLILHEWSDLDWKRRLTYRAYTPLASRLLFSSPTVRRRFETDRWIWPLRRLIAGTLPVPPNIADPGVRLPSPLQDQMRAWRAAGRFVLASFGALYARKQTTRLLDITAALRERGVDAALVMIGDFVQGDGVRDRFWARARDLGLVDHVRISGRIADPTVLFGLFDQVDSFVYSFAEGLTARRASVLACLQSNRPLVVNACREPDEFDGHPAYRALLQAGRLVLVAPDAGSDVYAETLIAGRRAQRDGAVAAAASIDFAACWDDAASALTWAVVGHGSTRRPSIAPVGA